MTTAASASALQVRDLVIDRSDGPRIAVRDYGGAGSDVLLLHGAGRTLEDWSLAAPMLRATGRRVVAADLRCHGASGDRAWTWPDVLDDVAAVVNEMGLNRPAVVGHSLGGMVAVMWGTEHSECPLAVNVDGHGNPRSAVQYDGLDPAEAARAHGAMSAFVADARRAPEPMPVADADATVAQMLDAMNVRDQAREAYFASAARSRIETGNGRVLTRPCAPYRDSLFDALDALDVPELYARAQCPVLVVSAGLDQPGTAALPQEVAIAYTAYRRWLARTLQDLTDKLPTVQLATMPTGHDVHLDDPSGLVRILDDALAF